MSLSKSLNIVLFSNVMFTLAQFGILMVIAKYSSLEVLGQYVLALTITSPVMMFMNMQMRSVISTDSDVRYVFEDYLYLKIGLMLIGSFIVIALSVILGKSDLLSLIILVWLVKCIDLLVELIYGLNQKDEKFNLIAKSRLAHSISLLFVFVISFIITQDLVLATFSLLIIRIIVFVAIDVKILRSFLIGNYTISFRRIKDLFMSCLPLGLVELLVSLQYSLPRLIIDGILGTGMLGIYSALAYLPRMGVVVNQAFIQVGLPKLFKLHQNDNQLIFKKGVITLALLSLSLGLAGYLLALLIGEEILSILYTHDFIEYFDVLLWVILAFAFAFPVISLSHVCILLRINKIQPLFISVGLVINCCLCLYLLPDHGLYGVAVSLLVSNVCVFVAYLYKVFFSLSVHG